MKSIINNFEMIHIEFSDCFQAKKESLLSEYKEYLADKDCSIIKNLPLNSRGFFWLDQLQNLLELNEFIDDCEEEQTEELSEIQDIIFSVLSESEYAQIFMQAIEEGQNIKNASIHTRDFIKNKLQNFASLYFQSKPLEGHYQNIFEFAEFDEKLIGPRKEDHYFNESDIRFFTFDRENLISHTENISNAIETIQKASPTSFERLKHFTKTILPHKQEQMVSYSEQTIPGHSIINLFNRDRVDLMDDLLHENGHHHLNYFLNSGELIIEDEEKDYFSPWRETMRPLRGIYHAVFTFYWALELFHDLIRWDRFKDEFSSTEQFKITNRFLEEFIMLSFCQDYLEAAYKEGRILELGKAIVDEIYENIAKKITLFESLKNETAEKLIEKLQTKKTNH